MSAFTDFANNLLKPVQQKTQQAQQSYKPPVQQQQPKRSFFDNLLDTISPYLAPVQKALQGTGKKLENSNVPLISGTASAGRTFIKESAKTLKTFVSRPPTPGNVGKSIFGQGINLLNFPTEAVSKATEKSVNQTKLKDKTIDSPLGPINIAQALGFGAGLLVPTGKFGKAGKAVEEASSAISFIKNGRKVFTRVTPNELAFLKNEIKNIPRAPRSLIGRGQDFQLHLDPLNTKLTSQAVELGRSEFVKLHPQAKNVFSKANRKITQFVKGKDGKFAGSTSQPEGLLNKFANKVGMQARQLDNSSLPIADKQAAGLGYLTSISGNPSKAGKGFAALPKNLQDSFQDLVNGRSASNVVQKKVAQQFKVLDRGGVQDLVDLSKGVDRPGFKQAREYLDNVHSYLKTQGFDVNYKENYLTGAYQNSADEVEKAFRKLGLNPSFTKESLFKNYEEGIKAGLTPRFNKLSELIGYYSGRVNTAVANKTIWKELTEQGLIRSKASPGWTRLDPDAFPGQGFKFVNEAGEVVTHSGSSFAPDDLAKSLNNYFKQSDGALSKFANFSSTVKNIILSSGIPKTGVNFHGFTTLFRSGFSPKAAGYLLKPGSASNFVNANLDRLEFFVKKGLKATTEEHTFQDAFRGVAGQNIFSKSLNKVIKTHQILFEDPLFQKVLPALKLQKAEGIYKGLIKSGMASDDAAREASRQANAFFGGINWEQMGRSKETQNVLRSLFLAPDLLESQLQLGTGVAKSLLNPRDPKGKAFRDFARTFVLSYILLNLANKESTGKWAFENPAGHAFEFKVGDTYIRPYASGADFLRLPVDFATALYRKDGEAAWSVVKNRVSSPLQAVGQAVTGTDRFGNPLLKNKFTGKPLPVSQQLAGVAGIAGNLGVPSYAQAGINVASGRSSLGKGIVQGLELPVRFAPKTKTKSSTRKRGYSRR